jgi:hypothetical protein
VAVAVVVVVSALRGPVALAVPVVVVLAVMLIRRLRGQMEPQTRVAAGVDHSNQLHLAAATADQVLLS